MIDRDELDRLVDFLEGPSDVYAFMVETLEPEQRRQLRRLIPKAYQVTRLHKDPSIRKDGLRTILVHGEQAASVFKMIFANDGIAAGDNGTRLTRYREHQWRKDFGQWPWER